MLYLSRPERKSYVLNQQTNPRCRGLGFELCKSQRGKESQGGRNRKSHRLKKIERGKSDVVSKLSCTTFGLFSFSGSANVVVMAV